MKHVFNIGLLIVLVTGGMAQTTAWADNHDEMMQHSNESNTGHCDDCCGDHCNRYVKPNVKVRSSNVRNVPNNQQHHWWNNKKNKQDSHHGCCH